MGITDSINELLGTYCSGGYGGTVGQANFNYLKSEYGDVEWLWFGSQYRLGDVVRFAAPVNDSRRFAQFVEDISGLKDYPVICEDTWSELEFKLEEEEWEELVSEHNLDWEFVSKVRETGDYNFYDEGLGNIYGLVADFNVEEFVAEVRLAQQTWLTHYYSQMTHLPEVCGYCKDAELEVA